MTVTYDVSPFSDYGGCATGVIIDGVNYSLEGEPPTARLSTAWFTGNTTVPL